MFQCCVLRATCCVSESLVHNAPLRSCNVDLEISKWQRLQCDANQHYVNSSPDKGKNCKAIVALTPLQSRTNRRSMVSAPGSLSFAPM